MTKKTAVYQGKIATATRNDGTVQEIHAYANSSDFPGHQIITMPSTHVPETSRYYAIVENHMFPHERVPLTQEIWRAFGKAMGYKFVERKKKEG